LFIAFVGYVAVKAFLKFSPYVRSPIVAPVLLTCDILFLLCVCADACRHSIVRLGAKRWLGLLAIAAAIPLLPFLFLRQFVLQPFYIPTGGMQPTLMGNRKTADGLEQPGDSIMVDKFSYRFHEPRRGDIVVFKTTGLEGVAQNQVFVKRLVGLPGESVSIHSPFLYINRSKVIVPKVFERIALSSAGFPGNSGAGRLSPDGKEVALGKDEFLVLGDNAQNSLDGRFFGAIKRKSIIGKVAWIYSPPERKGCPE